MREPELTKREYFAGLAMQAYISLIPALHGVSADDHAGLIVRASVQFADQLIVELNLKNESEPSDKTEKGEHDATES